MRSVYLIVGVPGAGKTWVAKQFEERLHYMPQDRYFDGHARALIKEAQLPGKPIITECPFAERELVASLERAGIRVYSYFVVEEPKVVKERYEAREKKPCPPQHLTRAISIRHRAQEWKRPMGKSSEVLALLNRDLSASEL